MLQDFLVLEAVAVNGISGDQGICTHYQVLVGTSPVDSDSCQDYLTT